jgi:uncharacterized membrane protein
MGKSSTGLEENIAGLLSYVLGWVTGIIFFFIEKDNKFVKFHAMQSIIFFGGISVLYIIIGILSWIPYIGLIFTIINILLGIFAFVMWIIFMIKAYKGEKYMFPITGKMAEKYSS